MKELIKKCIPKNELRIIREIKNGRYRSKHIYKDNNIQFLNKLIKKRYISLKKNKTKQLQNLFEKINIDINIKNGFIYSIDENKILLLLNSPINNLTIDYSKIIEKSFIDYKDKEITLIIIELINKYLNQIEASNINDKEKYLKYFKNIKDKKAEHFEEGLQRILFLNSILWQTNHSLNGLGRLDIILANLYKKDIDSKFITKKEARIMISNFIKTLHEYYEYKSACLLGDTGQIIILGGLNQNDKYEYNDLTYMFIEELEKLNLPDPKILLRVSKKMPKNLLELAIKCISTGIGGPLLSNDDVIIDKLVKFGYSKDEASNYVTAACWEPSVPGISIAQNNLMSVNYLLPLQTLLNSEDLEKITSMKILLEKFDFYLSDYLKSIQNMIDEIKFEEEPIMSLFIDECIENSKDLSQGGAKNKDYGFTGVALPNLINSFLNIKRYVFEEKIYTLKDLNEFRNQNFKENDVLNRLKSKENKFGCDSEEVINLTRTITNLVQKNIENYRNRFGGRMKIGYSAPSYISGAVDFPASLDGRKNNESFDVHISSKSANSYIELIQFASKLDYSGNKFNGNVVDFMISKDFIENNFSKFTDLIMAGIENGFFQMQINVLSSDILIDAKNNPDKYPNLIVRVWGFSSYFNDLPEEYKNLLIERALQNEGKSN